jgi:hypothetical protein
LLLLVLVLLLQARQASSQLGDALEDPSHPATAARVRLLGGRIPEKDELVAKLQVGMEGGVGWL